MQGTDTKEGEFAGQGRAREAARTKVNCNWIAHTDGLHQEKETGARLADKVCCSIAQYGTCTLSLECSIGKSE